MDVLTSIHPLPGQWLNRSDLADIAPLYVQRLASLGYACHTQRVYLYCVAHFAHWKSQCRIKSHDLAPAHIARFLDAHLPSCRCAQPARRCRHECRAALRQLLATLRDAGIPVAPREIDAIEDELSRFGRHMEHARGLAINTRNQRLHILRELLMFGRNSTRTAVPLIEVDQLRGFIAQKLSRWSPASAQVLATTLRGYLRFRACGGDDVKHLLPVIATPANWRLAPLPATLSDTELDTVLSAFPEQLPSMRRAYAMVRCLVDLGLRAREVVQLRLDDIDWRSGTIRLDHNKSRRVDVLPLPRETGEAIARYMEFERPRTSSRCVFVRHVAPVDAPVGPGIVRRAMREAYERCGSTHTGVHVLRHTLARRVLASGGTLKEVSDLLRHRSLDTSQIYAKVDTSRLSQVALPWPGSTS